MVETYGEGYRVMPDTYVLPEDRKHLIENWGEDITWIVKPIRGSNGRGIYLTKDKENLPERCVVQKYVNNPYLINGVKFDLRIYVLVTNFCPIVAYIYSDGLVRFATNPYTMDNSNKFCHLTNYSLNSKNKVYKAPQDADSIEGQKWRLETLWKYLQSRDIDVEPIKESIKDAVRKTLVAGEHRMKMFFKNPKVRYYDILGIDILLDSDLKPWVLEVNVNPRLLCSSAVDECVKEPLLKEALNIVGYPAGYRPMKLIKSEGDARPDPSLLLSFVRFAEENTRLKKFELILPSPFYPSSLSLTLFDQWSDSWHVRPAETLEELNKLCGSMFLRAPKTNPSYPAIHSRILKSLRKISKSK
ncbi:TTLL4 [Cordylochernes scorpioides]|uniref:TTLL4 n=1 Tax=Cordylochernes scorpioides TaxID=51811 RepID=A0ABY6K621_9ARAC|nr:TTLL4 [Cordylochernes scorpioides]